MPPSREARPRSHAWSGRDSIKTRGMITQRPATAPIAATRAAKSSQPVSVLRTDATNSAPRYLETEGPTYYVAVLTHGAPGYGVLACPQGPV